MPEAPIKGSAASASSIAHIMVQKYMNALPLYRQEKMLARWGAPIPRQTLSDWIAQVAGWTEILRRQLHAALLKGDYLQLDETWILTESDLKTIPELSEKNIHHFLDYFKQEGADAYPWLFWWVGLQLQSSLLVKSKRFENDFVFFHGPFTRLWELQCMVTGHGGVVRVNYSPIVTIVVVSDQVHLLDAQALYPDVEVVTETMFLESIK
jgi:hypothetical protein